MNSTRPLFSLLAIILLTGVAHAAADPQRLAVISTVESAALASLVTAELSADPGIALVERDALAKIGDEAKLQRLAGSDSVALGKLVGASGLLFVDKTSAGFHVRFTAVGLGYALFDDDLAADGNLTQIAKSLAHRLESYVPKLALDPSQAVPLSVLNLRADLGNGVTLPLERNLTLLLESRLAAVPEFVVLERRHAWSLGFEKSLDPSASKPLLHGAWLIDGNIAFDGPPGSCTVSLRLRGPDGTGEKTISVPGNAQAPGALADQLLAKIKAHVGRKISESAPAQDREATEYLREALWGWRAGVPAAALEAVDSAELLGAAPGDVIPLRCQILCALADQGMERWQPGWDDTPVLEADALTGKVDPLLRVIAETVRYRDEKLESQSVELKSASGTERFDFRTGRMIAEAAFVASKTTLLLDTAKLPRADELRHALRALTAYDPLNGKRGATLQDFVANNGCISDVFADTWAQTLEEELAWYRLACLDTEWRMPRTGLANPAQHFCSRFLATPEAREKAFQDFAEGLKDDPKYLRNYLVLATNEKDPAVADAAFRAYVAYLQSLTPDLGTTDADSSALCSLWQISGAVASRNAQAALPLIHSILKAEKPGRCGVVVLRVLWRPYETAPADVPGTWSELNDYMKRKNSVMMEKTGRPSNVDNAELEQFVQAFKNKFPDLTKPVASDLPPASALVVNRFWHPWLEPSSPVDNNFLISATSIADDSVWIAGYFNHNQKGKIFKVHLPDLKTTEALDTADGKMIQGMLWNPRGLYATLESDRRDGPGGGWLKHQLARYDFTTAAWTKHDLPVLFSPHFYEVNGDLYLATAAPGASPGEKETGILKYNWDADKSTLLASNRRRPGQNQFDDTPAYEVTAIFAGPENKPAVTTNTGTWFIQESPVPWPPVFDSRFNDAPIPLPGQTLIVNQMGEVTLIDPKAPAPVGLMAATEPIWRKAKGSPGVTGPVPTPWKDQAIWDAPSARNKQMGSTTVAYYAGRLFIFSKPDALHNSYELLCYDQTTGRKPVHLPLRFELTGEAKTAMLLHPGHMPNGWTLEELEQPRSPFTPQLVTTREGLCLKLMVAGFWFIPWSELEARLKSQPAPIP